MIILIKVIQVILALSLLVLVHEFGHFFFARLFKIRVEKFYLFFDWKFSLFKWKPKRSDTEYGVGWLPFGGYCKIAGMIDESLDKEQLKKDPEPWEYRAHPAWQRFFVIFGGVFFNAILAMVIYSCSLLCWGEEYIKNSDVTTGIAANALAEEIGFRNGDKILKIEGREVEKFESIMADIIHSKAQDIKVLRQGEEKSVYISPQYFSTILSGGESLFWYGMPFVTDSVFPASPNFNVLKKGDRIIGLDSTATPVFSDVQKYVLRRKSDSVTAKIVRSNDTITASVAIDTAGHLGVLTNLDPTKYYKVTKHNYSVLSAIPAGIKKTGEQISNYWKELKLIVSPETKAYKSVGSFIAIGKIFPDSWNWPIFWHITALLSIMLAVLNVLPIPALDGGHLLFTLYEMVTGRKPSDKFLMAAQTVGMVLLCALMILAFGNDILHLFK